MASSPEHRLQELGIELPEPHPAAGTYASWTRAGDLVFLAGQGSRHHLGRVGAELDLAAGREAAREAMLDLLAQTRDALGSLDRVGRVVRVTGYVRCTEDFIDQPAVLDGATDLLVEVFGPERGRPARAAVGVASLPMGIAVEIEMVVVT